jgi:putative peptidoglycan lipid II flippase
MTQNKSGLGKVFGLVAISTVASKFVGLARDIVVLSAFGTSYIADAYNFAYLLTGNIFVLFGGLGGPFHSSAVAILASRKNQVNVGALASQILTITALVTVILSAVAWLLAPIIVPLLAPATGHPIEYKHEFWQLTVTQLRIMLPLIVIAGLVGIFYGIANIFDKYFWPSIAPAAASAAIIVAVLFFRDQLGLCLAFGTLVGAVLQLVIQIPQVVRSGLKWSLPTKLEPGCASFFTMLWPAVISTSIGQLTVYVDAFFTSQLQEGAWTAIFNANKLVQLPLGVLVTAMIVPILARFTLQVAEQKIADLKLELRRALRFLWFLALPISAILLAMPGTIISLLFERGHFNDMSRDLMTTALVFLIPSVFFYVARDLVTRVFYAHHDTQTPYLVGMAAIVLKFILDWALIGPFGVGGITLSTTFVTIFNLSLLSYLLTKKIGTLEWQSLAQPVAIMLTASALCGGATYYVHQIILGQFVHPNWLALFAATSLASLSGLAAYLAVCFATRLDEPLMLVNSLRAKLGK